MLSRCQIYCFVLLASLLLSFFSLKFWSIRDSPSLIPTGSPAHLVIHRLCDTQNDRELVNIPMIQDGLPAIASVLAGSSKKSSDNELFLQEIDFLIMFERNNAAMSSKTYFTQCFLDWKVDLSIKCEIIGYGIVQGNLTLSYRYNMNKEGHLRCPVDSLKIPLSKKLSVRLIDTMHHLNGSIKLCLLNPYRKIHKLVGCSQPLFNVDKLEAKWPGLIRMWVRFYINYLKFGAVNIYDIDGSTEPYIKSLVKKGVVNYYKRWAPTESMYNLALSGSLYCSETMMENQCLWQHRGLSEWVMLIHSPDNFLNDFAGAPTLIRYLDDIENKTALTLLTTLVFGHSNVTIPKQKHANNLFETIGIRECSPIYRSRSLPVANPREVMMLFVHVALEPFDRIPTTVDACPVNVNHYVTMFQLRSIHGTPLKDNMFCNDSTLHEKTKSYLSLLN
jgi:hypothetical protein